MPDSEALYGLALRTKSWGEMQDAKTLKHDVHRYDMQW